MIERRKQNITIYHIFFLIHSLTPVDNPHKIEENWKFIEFFFLSEAEYIGLFLMKRIFVSSKRWPQPRSHCAIRCTWKSSWIEAYISILVGALFLFLQSHCRPFFSWNYLFLISYKFVKWNIFYKLPVILITLYLQFCCLKTCLFVLNVFLWKRMN